MPCTQKDSIFAKCSAVPVLEFLVILKRDSMYSFCTERCDFYGWFSISGMAMSHYFLEEDFIYC